MFKSMVQRICNRKESYKKPREIIKAATEVKADEMISKIKKNNVKIISTKILVTSF